MEKKLSRKEAIDKAIECVRSCDMDHDEELMEVLFKIRKSFERKSTAGKKSKVRIENEQTANQLFDLLEAEKEYRASDVIGLVDAIQTASKGSAILSILAEDGRMIKTKNKKTTIYSLKGE